MSNYLSPGVYTKETDFSFYTKQLSTSVAAMIGIAEKGPINQARLVTSWEQFVDTFGSYIANGFLAYAAKAFFDNGGQQLYVVRVAHYANITDAGTLAAAKATITLAGRDGAKASLTTGASGTDEITWTAKEGGVNGNSITVALIESGNSTPLSVSVSGSDIVVNLATDETGAATSTVAEVIAAVEASEDADALVDVASGDSGVVSAAAEDSLAGGDASTDSLSVSAINEGTWGDDLSVSISDNAGDADAFDLQVKLDGEVVEVFQNLSMDEANANHVEQVINEVSEYITVEDLASDSGLATDRPASVETALAGGNDGLTDIADSDYIGDSSQHTGLYGLNGIDALNMLAIPGISSAAVIHAALTWCEGRKDVFFIADSPVSLEPLEVKNFRRGEGGYSHSAFNSSYGGLYWPWLEISDPLTSKKKLVPPSGAVAGCFARNDEQAEVWYAPAGIDRGRVFNALGLGYNTSRAERDVVYPAGVNVIASFADSGINIWGQRTLQAQPSATDRVNVRRLMMYIEESIGESSRFAVFQPNVEQTWNAIKRLIEPFLLDIQTRDGLYRYEVQCDADTVKDVNIDRYELPVRIGVQPTKAAEMVEMNFVMTQTGAVFSEVIPA